MGQAVICGPAMDDFASSMDVLRQAEGIVQCTPDALKAQVASLMHEASARAALGQRAQAAIEACQGASDQAAARLLSLAE